MIKIQKCEEGEMREGRETLKVGTAVKPWGRIVSATSKYGENTYWFECTSCKKCIEVGPIVGWQVERAFEEQYPWSEITS